MQHTTKATVKVSNLLSDAPSSKLHHLYNEKKVNLKVIHRATNVVTNMSFYRRSH